MRFKLHPFCDQSLKFHCIHIVGTEPYVSSIFQNAILKYFIRLYQAGIHKLIGRRMQRN